MDDLISRQAALKAVSWDSEAYFAINNLPIIDPVKHGKWIFDPDGMDWNIPAWKCSECYGRNSMIPTYIRRKDKMIKVENPLRWAGSKFCPNCGAMMERSEE